MNQWLHFLKPARPVMLTNDLTPKEAEDGSAARKIVEADPAVRAGMISSLKITLLDEF